MTKEEFLQGVPFQTKNKLECFKYRKPIKGGGHIASIQDILPILYCNVTAITDTGFEYFTYAFDKLIEGKVLFADCTTVNPKNHDERIHQA